MSKMKRFLLMLGVAAVMVTSAGCGAGTSPQVKQEVATHNVEDYREFITKVMEEQSIHFGAFTVLAGNPKFSENQWKTDMGMVLGGISITSMDYLGYTAIPEGYEEIDAEIDKAMENYISFTKKTAKGIDDMSPDILAEANKHMLKGVEHISTATDLMKKKN